MSKPNCWTQAPKIPGLQGQKTTGKDFPSLKSNVGQQIVVKYQYKCPYPQYWDAFLGRMEVASSYEFDMSGASTFTITSQSTINPRKEPGWYDEKYLKACIEANYNSTWTLAYKELLKRMTNDKALEAWMSLELS